MLQAQHHCAVKRIEASLHLVHVLVALVAQLDDEGQHTIILGVVEREARTLQQLVVQVVHVLHNNLVDGEMSAVALAFRVHHSDEVAVPIDHLLALLVAVLGETRYILVLDARELAAIGADDVLHLPHIEHELRRALLS